MKRKYARPELLMLVLLGLLAAAGATAQTAEDPVADESGSVSPSQISRDRINAIRSNEFFYQSYGRTDPFLVLVSGEYEQSTASELVDVHSATLVGVMWGQDDRFALVEDGDGFGYILRVGDKVQNGRIVSIRKDSLTARVTLYGITNQVVLKLEKSEG
ncbi:MAG: hypothetical protein ABIK96_09885 [bacterium]